MPTIAIAKKERAERLLQWRQDGVKAASEYEAKERATRLLTAKLRTERLARDGKHDKKKAAKA
jgi:hypothetical protein